MAADLRLVAHAADRDALERAVERAGDRAAQRGLAHAGRADEAEDRGARVRLQLAHGEELEDAVLHRLDVVVVLVEPLARGLQVERVLAEPRPGQRGEPLEVGADDPVLDRLRRQALEALQLAVGLLAGVLGQARLVELSRASSCASASASSTSPSSSWIAFSCWRSQYSRWPLSISDWTCDWMRVPISTSSSSRASSSESVRSLRGHVRLLEQVLLLLRLDPERPRDHVRELRGVVEVRDRDLQLLRQVGHLLDDSREASSARCGGAPRAPATARSRRASPRCRRRCRARCR